MNEIIESLIQTELQKAESKHAPINSGHEAYGIIKEEIEEMSDDIKLMEHSFNSFWRYVKQDDYSNQVVEINYINKYVLKIIKEAIQVAAMCERFKKDMESKLEF